MLLFILKSKRFIEMKGMAIISGITNIFNECVVLSIRPFVLKNGTRMTRIRQIFADRIINKISTHPHDPCHSSAI